MWIFSSSIDKKMNSLALLILRTVMGVLMLTHGLMKFDMLLAGGPIKFPDPIGLGATASLMLAIFAEVVCSALLILGLATRLVLIPLIITMLVVVFIVHAPDGLEKQELGALYLAAYVLLLITGSGRYSIDGLINKRKKRRY
ncbi:DoxX family protein [Flavobacterium subsaxonicum WB 4.1-42 = DSM 21790]|uniref:DoxX family protein n=2 Tax=Flavobacterium TaxID=237 RepID=A0A0A2MLC7_9FLAO|nr:DoxX family protein [Flavobacterium subsaxonicum WB 4.1-42 = DSM 21790]